MSQAQRLGQCLVVLLGLASVFALALRLARQGALHYLDSDVLSLPALAADLLVEPASIRGWTFSPAPYFFPDLLTSCAVLAACGHGEALAVQVGLHWTCLALLMGLSLRPLVGRLFPALLAGLLLVHLLLALQVSLPQVRILYWIGVPGFHGGALLSGFVFVWLTAEAIRRGALSNGTRAFLILLGAAAVASDTLFLLQFLLPLLVAVYLHTRTSPPSDHLRRTFFWIAGSALALSFVGKALLGASGLLHFSTVARYPPTPANQWRAFSKFLADLGPILEATWVFLLLGLAAFTLVRAISQSECEAGPANSAEPSAEVRNFFLHFVRASVLLMLPLPFLAGYYKDPQSLRYWLNLAVLPGFLLAAGALWAWPRARAASALTALLGAAFLTHATLFLGSLQRIQLALPVPSEVAALDVFLRREQLRHGLAEYWQVHRLNALLASGARLRQLGPDAQPRFWSNNASGYFDSDPTGQRRWPAYEFILTNALDEKALLAQFGEPAGRERIGPYSIWIYAPSGQERIRAVLEPQIRRRLD